ncbi:MAG: hypothetical protein ABR550_02605, partial [Wenzhouxiangellaceae bacterium]
FLAEVHEHACQLAADPQLSRRIAEKKRKRRHDEAQRPLADYRADEFQQLAASFDDPQSRYHRARRAFVMKQADEAKPAYWRVPQCEVAVARGQRAASGGRWRAMWQRMLGSRINAPAARQV